MLRCAKCRSDEATRHIALVLKTAKYLRIHRDAEIGAFFEVVRTADVLRFRAHLCDCTFSLGVLVHEQPTVWRSGDDVHRIGHDS